MASGRADERLVVERRGGFLELIATEPRQQAEIADALDVSRSTVTRAMRELGEHGLVERTNGRYRVSPLGRAVLQSYRRYSAVVRSLYEYQSFIEYIPEEAPFDPFLFAEGICHLVEEGASFKIRERINREFRSAERIVGMSRTRSVRESLTIFYETVIEENNPVEYILSADLYSHVSGLENGKTILQAENSECSIHENIPYGLFVLDQGDLRWMVMIVYDESDSIKGVLTNRSPFAIAWAESVYEDYLEESVPVKSYSE